MHTFKQGVAVAWIEASGYRGMANYCSHECLLAREVPQRLNSLLKNWRFVSGHRFSDAVTSAQFTNAFRR